MLFSNKITFPTAFFTHFIALSVVLFTTSCTTPKKDTPTDLEASTLSEGTMTFDVSLKNAENIPGLMKMMLPKEGKCYFSGNKMAMAIDGLLSGKVVSDGDSKTFLTNINGEKKQIGEAEISEKIKKSPAKLVETNETKQILGMTATKYALTIDSTATPFNLYVVKDAPVGDLYWALPTGTLKGLIVEYEFKSEMGALLLTAKSIDKQKPDASVFK